VVAGASVVQVIVAEFDVIPVAEIALKLSVGAPDVVKLKSGEVDVTPAEFVEMTE
jgi:hypothetical protein